MANFCHIAPTDFLSLTENHPAHLLLAHLVDDEEYTKFFKRIKSDDTTFIVDNSAFEMYKQGKPMLSLDSLLSIAGKVQADYVVMSDYPNQHSWQTIAAAINMAPILRSKGYGTFFCPQSKIGDKEDLINCFDWASTSHHVDYIGVSILAIPNAYNVERDNKLQRFVARYMFMQTLQKRGILKRIYDNGKKIHLLGMVDGPNEIKLMEPFSKYIHTWDSSAAAWFGLNGGKFDQSPTGIFDGKFEKEVDFNLSRDHVPVDNYNLARYNINYIDTLLLRYLNDY